MAIWIDRPAWPAHGTLFSHLVSTLGWREAPGELRAFMADVGLHPRSFDGDHADVPAERFDACVAAGAQVRSGREIVQMLDATGQRLRRRRGERVLARAVDALPYLGVGHLLDVVRSPLLPPDASTRGVAVFVTDAAGAVLLVHTPARDEWSAPAGRREAGESVAEAALRELDEESGLSLPASALVAVGYERLVLEGESPRLGWPAGETHIACFAARLETVSPQVRPVLDDVSTARWATPAEAGVLCGHQSWWPLLDGYATARKVSLSPSASQTLSTVDQVGLPWSDKAL